MYVRVAIMTPVRAQMCNNVLNTIQVSHITNIYIDTLANFAVAVSLFNRAEYEDGLFLRR